MSNIPINPTKLFRSKLTNIRTILMQAYENTKGFTTPVQGDEREVVIRELLQLILPLTFRLGKGPIIDAFGHETGQVDAVLERPFSLSFPISSQTNRLYLADNVAAAFEIKSDLKLQANQVKRKVKEIKQLTRIKPDSEVISYDRVFIPTFVIAFKGHSNYEELYKTFRPNARRADYINGVLVIDSGTFIGRSPTRFENGELNNGGREYCISKNPEGALLMFFDCLSNTLRHEAHAEVDLFKFKNLLKGPV